jgi:KDO2-lipid IV(A) lauroyltransferase
MTSWLYHSHRRLETWGGNRILLSLLRLAPRFSQQTMIRLGRLLGDLVPRISRRHFLLVCADIALALHLDSASEEVRRIAYESYRYLGESMAEFLRLPYMTTAQLRTGAHLEGIEHLDAALARGKGAILLTGHLGNWEICGTLMGLSGYPTTAITREQNDSALTEMLQRVRQTHGLQVVSVDNIRACIQVLQRNECLGILGDMDASIPASFVQVFGRPAATHFGTAYFAHRSGAAILPIFDERLPDHTHIVRIGSAIPPSETGDLRRDLFYTTIRTQEVIEREIRRRPTEWFWLGQRWRTRPEMIPHPERIPMEHRDLTSEESARIRHWEQ